MANNMSYQILKRGDNNQSVAELQMLLNRVGAMLVADGKS